MNGVHDMGGIQNMGPVEVEDHEPVFHAEWERRVFAINMATGPLGLWNLDMKRQATERMSPPGRYLNAPYYERWLESFIGLFKEHGILSEEELSCGEVQIKSLPELPAAVSPQQAIAAMQRGNPARLDEAVAPKFSVGDRIRTKNINPPTHTRLPRYARDKQGVIDRDHGVFIFPDTHSQNWDKKPQHVYSVRFTMRELWGEDASAGDTVMIDLWDDYMEAGA